MNLKESVKTLIDEYQNANRELMASVECHDAARALAASARAGGLMDAVWLLTGDVQWRTLADYQKKIAAQHVELADNAKLFGVLQ